jgi:hypothetical protein
MRFLGELIPLLVVFEIRKRAKNVTMQYLLQKHVDKVKLRVRFCSLLDLVLETMINKKNVL